MTKTALVLMCFLLFLAACVQKPVSNQSIQELVSKTPDIEDVIKQPVAEEKNETVEEVKPVNETKLEEKVEITDETPILNKKCRNSAIIYDSCKWTDQTKSTFTLRIASASKQEIPGVWFFITGESGAIKTVKRTEDILSKGTRTYTIDYTALVKEIGVVKRFEVLPIEEVNGTGYACENQRVYTIPKTYCKPSEPVKVG